MKQLRTLLGYAALTLTALPAAAVDTRDFLGEKIVNHNSPRGVIESCVIPSGLANANYSKKDLKSEAELCAPNFYTDTAICPKFGSTNPGLLFWKPTEKYSKAWIEASSCDDDKLKALDIDRITKYKQSTSCSYTPSILAYYHVSRALGNAAQVPVAVLRSMDAVEHKKQVDKATAQLAGSDRLIAQTWGQYKRVHTSPQRYPEVFDNSLQQVYGALVDNVKGEEKYTEVNGIGNYDTRYERFLEQKPFLNVQSSASVAQIVGSSEFNKVAATVVQMKDVSDMVIMDTLLSQQDRIGNIHFKFVWYFLDASQPGGFDTKKSKADLDKRRQVIIAPEEKAQMAAKNAVLVKEMILKDNDCGVAKPNMMKRIDALSKLSHVSYETYQKFGQLRKSLATGDTKNKFIKGMVFTEKDYANTVNLANQIAATLKAKCQSGALKFDIDLKDYVPGAQIQPRSCDI